MNVVIAAFRDQADAIGAQRALDSAGIAGEVRERSGDLPRLCADAFPGGFDVVVDEADADKGIALLQRLWPDEQVLNDPKRCPMCGSTEVFRLQRLWLFAAAAAILIILGAITALGELFLLMVAIVAMLLLLAPPWRCRNCKHTWR